MASRFLFQLMLLLMVGQLLLGAAGWALVGVTPWVGLPITLILLWFIWRLAVIFRAEVQKALRHGATIAPGRLAFFTALGAQLPGLLLLPYWAPDWIQLLWQGAALPVTASLGALLPAASEKAQSLLWLAAAVEIVLFVATAVSKGKAPVLASPDAPVKVAGDWVPARRVADVEKKGLRIK